MLAFNAAFPQSNHDIMTLSVRGIGTGSKITEEPRPFVNTPAAEVDPRFSPNGRWLAYSSGAEVFVRPIAGAVVRTQVSVAGGILPRWAANGTELFFSMRTNCGRCPLTRPRGFGRGSLTRSSLLRPDQPPGAPPCTTSHLTAGSCSSGRRPVPRRLRNYASS